MRRLCLNDGNAGQQKNSEQCAMRACHKSGSRLLQKPAKLSFPTELHRGRLARFAPPDSLGQLSLRRQLDLRLGRDWESPAIAERLGGDLDSWRRLLPLVLAALHH